MAANIVQHYDKSGNKEYPVTSSAAVGMSDGSGDLDSKLAELSSNTGLYNVDKNVPLESGFYTSSTARRAVPSSVRKLGLIITYKTDENTSMNEQYVGDSLLDDYWGNDNYWEKIPHSKELSELENKINDKINLFCVKSSEKNSGLLTTTGIMSNKSWCYTEYIKVQAGDIVFCDISVMPSSPYVALQIYNLNYQIEQSYDSGSVESYLTIEEDGYVRCCGRNTEGDTVILYVIKNQQKIVSEIENNSSEILNIKEELEYGTKEVVNFTRDGYITTKGTFQSHTLHKCTEQIPCDRNIWISLNWDLESLNCSAVNFYDSAGSFLSEESLSYVANTIYTNEKIVFPSNAASVVIVANSKLDYSSYSRIKEDSSSKKKFNKSVRWVGHSIWWYDGNILAGTEIVAKGYQTLLKNIFRFNSESKYCYSGQSLGGTSEDDALCILNRSSSWTGTEGDIWTLDSITNDFRRDIHIGTIEDFNNNTGITTYYGALRIFRDKVLELSGEDAVVICSNSLRRNNSSYTSTSQNSIGHTLVDYEIALMAIASNQGWIFVDQFRLSGITDDSIMITTIDGLHLNNFGYTLAVIPWILAFDTLYNNLLVE